MCNTCDNAIADMGIDIDSLSPDGDIVLYTHPTGNHIDVEAGSMDIQFDNASDPKPGDRIDVEEIVCNALIAPNGFAYYANDYGHSDCAVALGMSGVEDAMQAGYVHVAVTYRDISHYRALTASQKRTLQEMYFTAIMRREVTRCATYIAAYTAIAAFEGMDIE